MKFKKEYRWLLFLIIPFVVFMVLLFIVPLQILIYAQPLATKFYNLQKNSNEEISIRSSSFLQASIVQSLLQKISFYDALLNQYNQEEFFITNNDKLNINNAQTFFQENRTINQYKSMWFAGGISTQESLSFQQAQIMKNYMSNQLCLRSFALTNLSPFIVGIQNSYYLNSTEDMIFYFPSYLQEQLSNLSQSINRSIFLKLNENFQKTGNPFMMFSNSLDKKYGLGDLSLCKIKNYKNQSNWVTCFDLDSLKIGQFLQEGQLSLSSGIYSEYLITPSYKDIRLARVLLNLTIEIQKTISIESQNALFDQITQVLPQVFSSEQKDEISTLRTPNNYNIFSIRLQSSQESYLTSYFVCKNSLSQTGLSSNIFLSSDVVKSSVNTLLIPTIILIFISMLISVVVLRMLMNSLDRQLHKLFESCKFIVDGDLQIEIPQYFGTKDILEVYQEVKIINKLNRYVSNQYFSGHFTNRIFKYNEALEFIQKLGYDPSNVMQNIGQAYIYIEEYQKSINFLQGSIKSIEKEINQEFGGLDKMMYLKQQKLKIPNLYRQKQLILIRRLWKAVFCMFKYVQLQVMNSKQLDQQNLTEAQKQKKKQRLQKEIAEMIAKLKKAMYPDFKLFAECCMLLNFQVKYLISTKNFQGARDCLEKCAKITQLYGRQYEENTKKLKIKGSKNLLFFKKNKISGHSRALPDIMHAFLNYSKSLYLVADPKKKDYFTAIQGLFEGLKKNIASQSVNFLIMSEIRKGLTALGLKQSLQKLQYTQLFRQSMPYKSLFYGTITKQSEPLMYRLPKSPAQVECRQYVLMLDASYYYSNQQQLSNQLKFLKERSQYFYDKIIKRFDRVSLNRFNNEIGLQTLCNLILKESNQAVIRKNLIDMMNYDKFLGKNQLLLSLQRIITRIKHLQCQKVIIIYLKYMSSYLDQRLYRGRTKTKHRKKKIEEANKILEDQQNNYLHDIGDGIQQLMCTQGLRNCKLVISCAINDDCSKIVKYFGLQDINKRIWRGKYNKQNNLVYIIDERHKSDYDRLFMSKLANVSDNHVFAL